MTPSLPRVAIRRRLLAFGVLAGLLTTLLGGCGTDGWVAPGRPLSDEVVGSEFGLVLEELRPDEIPVLEAPKRLRPCCAFGSGLGVKVGAVPVLGFELVNMLGPDQLGTHEYDGGMPLQGGLSVEGWNPKEKNGLVYTCHGGFIDMAHLRLWADYTQYLTTWLARHARTGGTLPLADEGGTRQVVVPPVDPELLEDFGLRAFSVKVGQWIAFQMSAWHEIVTWYGWSHLSTFSELASAFSPEDMYSNLLGIKLSGAIVLDQKSGTERVYNDTMTSGIPLVLGLLGAQPREVGIAAAEHVDGVWWDSQTKLPAKEVVRRRDFEHGATQGGWLVQDMDGTLPPEAEACEGALRHHLVLDEHLGGTPISELAVIEIQVSDELVKAGFPLPDPEQRLVTPDDFPRIIEIVRDENFEEFGPHADRPERDGREAYHR